MLIIRVSYRARGPFARPKYDLALAIGAVNPSAGPPIGESGPVPNDDSEPSQTTVRTRKRFIALSSMFLLPLTLRLFRLIRRALAVLFARSAAAAPKTLTNKHNQARNHVTCFQ